MRYAVISDIHANRQALKAVLKDITAIGADEIICLGDIVGYGPSPVEVIDLLRNNVNHFILGNHDAVPAGYITGENFNQAAREVIEWTVSKLDKDAVQFLREIPLLLVGNNIRFAHGEFEDPARFGYVDDELSALATFNCCKESLMMLGHSHVPGLFVIGNSGAPHWLQPQDFNFEQEKRYIVNVGSVGQPRDNDTRASYCIVDSTVNDVLFRKVPFNIAEYLKDLQENSLPEVSSFLHLGIVTIPSSRETPPTPKPADAKDFTPLSKEDTVNIKREIQNLQKTVSNLKRSKKKLMSVIIILVISLITVVSSILFLGMMPPAVNPEMHFIPASVTQVPSEILQNINSCSELIMMPEPQDDVSDSTPLSHWSVAVSDPDKQQVKIITSKDSSENNIPTFSISSTTVEPVKISFLTLPVRSGMRFTASAQFKPINLDSGFIEILLIQKFHDGTEKILLKREPKNLVTADKWIRTSITISTKTPIAKNGDLYFEIRGQFTGEILLRKCSMKRKE